MKVVTYIEIDVPVCALVYGEAPCAASGAEGAECYNSLKTCQDVDNFTKTTAQLRWGYQDADDKSGIDYIPSLSKVTFRPQKVSLGEDIGVRASLTVEFSDHRDADIGDARDPYWRTRGGGACSTGTFWGKFRARHAYLVGSPIRFVQGIEGQVRDAMEARSFVIEKVTGPSLDGKVTVTAKDMLKLADDDKAQCPVISSGRLENSITSSSTTCTLIPSGIGNAEYPTTGYVAIGGGEVCSFTRSGDTLTLGRGRFSTEAMSHEDGDIVQLCKAFFDASGNGLDPADIIYDLLVNYSVVPAEWITIEDWRKKTEGFLQGRRYYALIADPTSVRDLLNELVYQAGIIIWTDDVKMQVRMDMVRNLATSGITIDEDTTIAGSFDVEDQPDKRLSQVWVYYGQKDPLKKVDESTNYAAAVAVVDDEMEDAYGIPSIRKIYSRWISRNNRPAATDVGYYFLSRFRSAPRAFDWSVWRDNPKISLAGRYEVKAWPLQLPDGSQDVVPVQVTELLPGDGVVKASGQEISWHVYEDQPDQGLLVVIDTDTNNINFRDEFNKSYSEPEAGETVTCLIEAGVIVGSTSTGAYAFNVGTWPAGVNVVIINNGYIVGAGGGGGNGGCLEYPGREPTSGRYGGPAIHTRSAVTITNDGIIGGGGGGGGGGKGYKVPRLINPATGLPWAWDYYGGGGGGGGAGYQPGPRGYGTNCEIDGPHGSAGTLLAGGAGGVPGTGYAGGGGGSLGQAGSSGNGPSPIAGGGAAGAAVDGDSYITWSTTGDIRGARVN